MAPQGKYWIFVKNVAVNDNIISSDLVDKNDDKINYAVWQLERGESGNLHYQGYVEFTSRTRMAGALKAIPNCHWEIRRGTAEEARKYSMKEDTRVEGPWEVGTWENHSRGKRTDLMTVKEELDKGATLAQVAEDHFGLWCRNHKAFSVYRLMKSPPRDFKSQVIVLVGNSRIGKTYWANKNTRDAYSVWNSKWFDDYSGTGDVIINDFTGWIDYNVLLNMLDAYPCKVEFKSGVVNFAPRRIVITSNFDWWEWYDWTKVKGVKQALELRIDHYEKFSHPPGEQMGTGWDDHIPNPWPIQEVVEEVAATPPCAQPSPDDDLIDGYLESIDADDQDEVAARAVVDLTCEETVIAETTESDTGEVLTSAEIRARIGYFNLGKRVRKRKNPFIDDEAGED